MRSFRFIHHPTHCSFQCRLISLYRNLQNVERFKQQPFGIFNSSFTKLPFTEAQLYPVYCTVSVRKHPLSKSSISSAVPSITEHNPKHPVHNLSIPSSHHCSESSSTGKLNQHPCSLSTAANVDIFNIAEVEAVTLPIDNSYF